MMCWDLYPFSLCKLLLQEVKQMFGTYFRVGFYEHKCGDLYLLLILLQVFDIFQGGTIWAILWGSVSIAYFF